MADGVKKMNDLKKLRINSGIKVKEVLEAYGDKRMDASLFSKIEAGIVPYPPKLFQTLLRLCDATVDKIYYLDGKSETVALANVDKTILDMLGYGKHNAISYEVLERLTGLDKRFIRKSVARLRGAGYPICNDQDGSGWYLSDDIDVLKRDYMRERHRAVSRLVALSPRRKFLKKVGAI